ncbi:MAG: AIR synthase related protein [Armatimonadetes bacterium]|nr:AIR synthase related protein [Armatimonadota bacterium]
MSEYDIIRSFSKAFARSPLQQNAIFSSDAELIHIGDQLWALTMDEFTPEEDLFTSDNPEMLGWNLAVATISDLFAVGAAPFWFMHAVSLPKSVDESFVSKLALGISNVLAKAECSLCGGDFGCADVWRFCGFAMGQVQGGKALTRLAPAEPQTLWVTGNLGDANLAALTNSPTPRFELRLTEAEFIRRHATACIDTSGGFFDALWLLHDQSPKLCFEIDLDRLPLAPDVIQTASSAGFPVEAALLGGAGEYELLFTLPEAVESPDIEATCVGKVHPSNNSGIFLSRNGEHTQMTDPPPCPRAAASAQQHIKEVMLMANRLFL